jgi:tartronate-semialdehyde synthase
VVVEVFLERITNIAMGADIDDIVEFNELADSPHHHSTAELLLD